jgi:hypothetical protein
VDPVPDPLLFYGSAGNRTRASGSVAKNSDSTADALINNLYHDFLKDTRYYRSHPLDM